MCSSDLIALAGHTEPGVAAMGQQGGDQGVTAIHGWALLDSGYFEYGVDFDGDVEGQVRGAHRETGVLALVLEDLDHEVRGAVDDFRLDRKSVV